MSEERKRVPKKEIPKRELKKRGEVVEIPKTKPVINEDELIDKSLLANETKKTRAKATDDKYIRYTAKELGENKLISERVLKNEIIFAYYAIDGEEGYFYYILIK